MEPLTLLTNSTSLVGTYSGGQFRTNFKTHWGLNHWLDDAGNSWLAISGTATSSDTDLLVWIRQGGEDSLKRALGCLLLSWMPDEAIDEAVAGLKDVLEFH